MTTNTSRPSQSKKPYADFLPIGVWIGLAIYYVIVIPHWGYVPLWDSLENLEEYLFLPRQHLTFDNLLLMHNGHPSLGYFWPFWIGQWLFPSSMIVVHIINLLIGSLAIVSFGKIVALAFEGMANRAEIALVTIAFAVQPVFVAYAVNMSPDYGVLAYFLATLWCLYAGQLGWAALTGVLLLFSKEIGVPSYLLLVMLYLSGAIRAYRWRKVWLLAIPFAVFGAYCAYQTLNGRRIFPWMGHFMPNESVWDIYLPNPLKGDFKMACLGPFIFEFQWIFTAVILAGLIYSLVANRPKGDHVFSWRRWLQSISLPSRCFLFLLAGCLYIDSRTVIFTNQRYFFVLYALVLLLFFAALIQFGIKSRFRIILLSSAAILLLCCNFRTLDPLSRKIAGTFSFGSHHLLSIGTIRPDVGDLNRDEMVYNLEHTHLSYLMDEAFEEIQPTDQTVLVMPGDRWWVMSRLDAKTFHRTESTELPFIKPIIESADGIANGKTKPQTVYVVLLPYFDRQKEMALLDPSYDLKAMHRCSEDGYEIQVLEMTRKPGLEGPPKS
jgi:hypothetical protein